MSSSAGAVRASWHGQYLKKQPFALKTVLHCPSCSFPSSCWIEALDSANLYHSLQAGRNSFFRTSRFVLSRLKSMQVCIKSLSCVESCRHRVTQRVRDKLASIYSNNPFANICGFVDVSLVNKNFKCKQLWWCIISFSRTFDSSFLPVPGNGYIFCKGRTVKTNVG